jgi:hypothetical protein
MLADARRAYRNDSIYVISATSLDSGLSKNSFDYAPIASFQKKKLIAPGNFGGSAPCFPSLAYGKIFGPKASATHL